MPVARRARPRPLKCAYREGDRQCPRVGTGNPPLCDAHRLAMAEAAKPRSPADVLSGVFENLLNGKPINVRETVTAAGAMFEQWKMGGNVAAGYHPGVPFDPREFFRQAHAAAAQGARNTERARQEAAEPPPATDPAVILLARQVMGFTDREPLTVDRIKEAKRRLAKRHHPDRGGSVAKMAAVNNAADVLLAELA